MLDPASNEDEGVGSGTGRVCTLSLIACVCWCRCRCRWRCGGVFSALRARGLPGGCPYLLHDVWLRLLEVVEGAEEASLDAGHVSSVRWEYFWVGVSGPGHSSAMRRAATMYGQSCKVVERGGVGHLRFGGASTTGSARRSNLLPPRRSGEWERDKWLSTDYSRRCDPLCTPFGPSWPGHAQEPAP